MRLIFLLTIFLSLYSSTATAYCPPNPVIFVTQIPIPQDFATINSTFGNHRGEISVRGVGDLYIIYPDCSLKNLTASAGYGTTGMQVGNNSIAVRDPAIHWSGTKAIFSMIVGAPPQQYDISEFYWQLYEITGLGKNETPVITKVPNQPSDYNNVMPIYGTDEQILFVSDRMRDGQRHLYPQRDEYESTATNTGLWKLNPTNGELRILDHSPSGDFNPLIDSYGRVIMTRWDHLQSDQQAGPGKTYGAFNFSSEAANSTKIASYQEVFPENQDAEDQAMIDPNTFNHRFNVFFPWMLTEDGTELETLNHIGRHELNSYLNKTFKDDSNLDEFYGQYSRVNQNSIESFHHIKEDPLTQGKYFGINCPEFGTHAAGQIVSINGAPSIKASQMQVTYVTHEDTSGTSDNPSINHSGLYRNPLPLSDGSLISSHTDSTRQDANIGTTENPASRYSFRLKKLTKVGDFFKATETLTGGIQKNVSFYNPDTLVTFSGDMWELQPVEVLVRQKPQFNLPPLPEQEQSILNQEGITNEALKNYLIERDLALIISRNITKRDSLDLQQPFNLRVKDPKTMSIGATTTSAPGKIYDVSFFQIFQGDLIRGYGGVDTPQEGRRVLATQLHDAMIYNPKIPNSPTGSTFIASDGSLAAFVPARRALTWQLTDETGKPVVRERLWLTFKAGEVRLCKSCHGITSTSQNGEDEPTNSPEALRYLLQYMKTNGDAPLPTFAPTPNIPTLTPTPSSSNITYKLAIKRMKQSQKKSNYKLTITRNVPQDSGALSLKLKINKISCSQSLPVNFQGLTKSISFSALHTSKKQKLVFELLRDSKSEKTSKVSISNTQRKRKTVEQLCKNVFR